MAQKSIVFNADRCVDCHACEVACASVHGLEPGLKPIKITQIWSGRFPDIKTSFTSKVCLQCENPACKEACPTEAMSRRLEDGVVLVDKEKCNGCQSCLAACTYEVPQFNNDGTMQKCDLCLGLDREPACVACCMADALTVGQQK